MGLLLSGCASQTTDNQTTAVSQINEKTLSVRLFMMKDLRVMVNLFSLLREDMMNH